MSKKWSKGIINLALSDDDTAAFWGSDSTYAAKYLFCGLCLRILFFAWKLVYA